MEGEKPMVKYLLPPVVANGILYVSLFGHVLVILLNALNGRFQIKTKKHFENMSSAVVSGRHGVYTGGNQCVCS